MLCNDSNLDPAGLTIAGKTLHANDEDSVYAIYELANCPCGVTLELGNKVPYLRFTPGIQLPRAARVDFERFQFDSDDEMMVDLRLDHKDGEITFNRFVDATDAASIEKELAPALAWVDKVVYPEIIAYIESCYRSCGD